MIQFVCPNCSNQAHDMCIDVGRGKSWCDCQHRPGAKLRTVGRKESK